jgi:hypothetical protein
MTKISAIIPSLREWAGLRNYLTLPQKSWLVIDPNYIEELIKTTKSFKNSFVQKRRSCFKNSSIIVMTNPFHS